MLAQICIRTLCQRSPSVTPFTPRTFENFRKRIQRRTNLPLLTRLSNSKMQLHHLLTAILGILATNTPVLAKGINCKGSIKCGYLMGLEFTDEPILLHADDLRGLIDTLKDTTWIPNKKTIACTSRSICAFLQNSDGMYAAEVKAMAEEIVHHGCDKCGSCPVGYPENNDGSIGELTFNYVRNRCGEDYENALCPYFRDCVA